MADVADARARGLRYHWEMDPRFAGPPPPWVSGPDDWTAWRARDAAALAEEAPDRRRMDWLTIGLTTPILVADMIELVVDTIARAGPEAAFATEVLDEAMPKLRRDAAAWVQNRTRGPTRGLSGRWHDARPPSPSSIHSRWRSATATQPGRARPEGPSAAAATRFMTCCSSRPAPSSRPASSPLASTRTWSGRSPRGSALTPPRRRLGRGRRTSDVLTTLVAADLLGSLDPDFDPGPTAHFLARGQHRDGWWRAHGPEASWLTVEILQWIGLSDAPFADQFRWPHIVLTNRDRRTGLPFYGY